MILGKVPEGFIECPFYLQLSRCYSHRLIMSLAIELFRLVVVPHFDSAVALG